VKKWIVIIVLLGAVGWVISDFIMGSNSNNSTSEEEFENTTSEVDPDSELEVGLDAGQLAPDFELQTVNGETMQLSDLRGEKVLLNFWATWCPPCRAEMPDMQNYHEEYDDGVILAVNLLETEQNIAQVEDFLEEFAISFPILLDETTEVTTSYNAFALPTSYFINKDGTIDSMAIGAINYDMLVEQFDGMD